jgi:hypothetical protein
LRVGELAARDSAVSALNENICVEIEIVGAIPVPFEPAERGTLVRRLLRRRRVEVKFRRAPIVRRTID